MGYTQSRRLGHWQHFEPVGQINRLLQRQRFVGIGLDTHGAHGAAVFFGLRHQNHHTFVKVSHFGFGECFCKLGQVAGIGVVADLYGFGQFSLGADNLDSERQ